MYHRCRENRSTNSLFFLYNSQTLKFIVHQSKDVFMFYFILFFENNIVWIIFLQLF